MSQLVAGERELTSVQLLLHDYLRAIRGQPGVLLHCPLRIVVMHPTTRLLAKGFLKRNAEEFTRRFNQIKNLESLNGPSGPLNFIDFNDPDSITECKAMCDKDIGGFSTVNFDWVPATETEPAHVRFHGNISTKLPADKPDVHRSGFAGWRTWDRPPTLFGRSLWDVERYTFLALRVKSDGRNYNVNLQTESIVPTDLHQHRLYTKKKGEWETVLIDWDDFVRTNHGFVVEPSKELMKNKVRTVGMSLTDSIPGPYELCISSMWGTNRQKKADEPAWKSDMQQGKTKLSPGRK